MQDVAYMVVLVAFFALAGLFVVASDRIIGPDDAALAEGARGTPEPDQTERLAPSDRFFLPIEDAVCHVSRLDPARGLRHPSSPNRGAVFASSRKETPAMTNPDKAPDRPRGAR